MQKFIVYPWSSLLLQNTGVGIIADIWYWPLQCCRLLQCRGAGVTAPHLTPPSLSAKMEQPLEETLMRCTTERCSCCSVGCKYNHHLSMYKLPPHLLRTLWSQPVTPWCCSAAVLQSPSPASTQQQTSYSYTRLAAAASTHNTLWTGQCRL